MFKNYFEAFYIYIAIYLVPQANKQVNKLFTNMIIKKFDIFLNYTQFRKYDCQTNVIHCKLIREFVSFRYNYFYSRFISINIVKQTILFNLIIN